jgi:hypothetical protein
MQVQACGYGVLWTVLARDGADAELPVTSVHRSLHLRLLRDLVHQLPSA